MGKLGVVVVAAGRGSRMGTQESKQYLLLQDKPIVVHTLELFEQLADVAAITLVVGKDDVDRNEDFVRQYGLTKVIRIIAGGAERQHSVYRGLVALEEEGIEWVLVHDGVRPFVKPEQAVRCYEKARSTDAAAVLAVPVKDTIKLVHPSGVIASTPDRRSLWAIQTPQAFRLSALLEAHRAAERDGFLGTDDAMLVERLGLPVHVVEGDYRNLKITTPEDLDMAEYMLSRQSWRGDTTR